MEKRTESPPVGATAPAKIPPIPTPKSHTPSLHPDVVVAQAFDVISLLLIFRFANALVVRTFFQPDEYFQALEPAWNVAFGRQGGSWLTWEWEHQLRSSLHPLLFGAVYKAANALMDLVVFEPHFKAIVLVELPKVVQSVFAALADFYTWKLATSIYGRESNAPWAAIWITVFSPWQWYCSTRTFSNSLETTLTIMALYYWPWEILADASRSKSKPLEKSASVNGLRVSLVLAAVAVVLRPTNLLIWLGILTLALTRLTLDGKCPLQRDSLLVLFREIALCGSAILAVSVLADRYYFGFWTFPPYTFLYFNISKALAVFYGHMPWHYYLSQGIPLLSTTFLPFVVLGLWKSTSPQPEQTVLQSNILKTLSFTVFSMVGALSVISHKEVRFIYPLLPTIHILTAPYIASFFTTQESKPTEKASRHKSPPTILRHKVFLANILSINILLAGYLSILHQPAAISVTHFLRTEFERLHKDELTLSTASNVTGPESELFALFLTPCHSTPWRSHLVYPGLRARALTCEPPLHTEPGTVERAAYLDEADRFYAIDPATERWGSKFLDEELWPAVATDGGYRNRGGDMPRYIVGFEGIEPVLQDFFGPEERLTTGVELKRVWSGWNGFFNEDWRRQGKLVVWDTGVYGNSPE